MRKREHLTEKIVRVAPSRSNFMDCVEFAFWQLHACSFSDACAARANDRHRVLWSASGRQHSPELIPARLQSDPALACA